MFKSFSLQQKLSIRVSKEEILTEINKLEQPISICPDFLHLAVRLGDTDILSAILEDERNLDLLDSVDSSGRTPLMMAIDQGHVLNAIIVFRATLKYYFHKYNLEYANFTPPSFAS